LLFLYLSSFLLSITFLFMIAVPSSLSSFIFLHLFLLRRVCDFLSPLNFFLSFFLFFLFYFYRIFL